MEKLSWKQVHSWRLAQQFLQPRANHGQMHAVVTRLGGIQAQVMAAAEAALGMRVDGLTPEDVRLALWKERTLVKTWAMRGTLHLVTPDDLPLISAARSAFPIKRPPSYYTYHGVTPEEYDAIIDGVARALSDEPLTREQLAQGVAELAGMPNLQNVLLSGWGALLKPSAFRGDLCFGPNQGQNVTFVRPQSWLGEWRDVDPQAAIQELARRYLNAFGPATTADFKRWFGLQSEAQAKKVFKALGSEIVEVDVDGWRAWALAGERMAVRAALVPEEVVRLLPQFDVYTVGVTRDCEPVLAAEHKARVYRAQGWISPVVLVDGRMEGVWEAEEKGARVKVEMFVPISETVRTGIKAEAKRLGKFLGEEVEVVLA